MVTRPDCRHFDAEDSNAVVIELPPGDVTEGVVRIGSTVRRPAHPRSFAVAAYLDHLDSQGFDGAPRFLGRDSHGRDVLTFIDGTCAAQIPESWARSEVLLASLGRLLRRLTDASLGYRAAEFPFPAPLVAPDPDLPELVSHMDVTPQNVVVRNGLAVGLVDFDLARPTTVLAEFANTAMHWCPLMSDADLWPGWETTDRFRRLRLLADSYGLDDERRRRLPAFAVGAAGRSWARMKARAEQDGGGWARMWAEGVGDKILRRPEWLRENSASLERALLGPGRTPAAKPVPNH